MSTQVFRSRFSVTFALATIFSAFILTAPADAQTPTTQPQAHMTEPPPAPMQDPAVPAPWWELIGGYEFDTHGSGYGFFGPAYTRPFKPGLAFTASVFPNYLHYEFDQPTGTTKVRSPGVSSMFGLRFGEKNFFKVGAGPEVKFRKTEFRAVNGTVSEKTDTRVGASIGAEMYVNPSPRNNIHALANYGTSDQYTWGRIGAKRQMNNLDWQGRNTTFLGVEAIGQGNDDIKSFQFGGFVEVGHVPSNVSVAFKAGYKRSTFPSAPDKKGPYFAVTFYKRLT